MGPEGGVGTVEAAGSASAGAVTLSASCPAVARAAVATLAQCRCVVSAAQPAAFVTESRTVRGGTMGKHVRHVLDHFRAILEARECGSAIEYDRRARNVPMESDPVAAAAAIDEVVSRLASLEGPALDEPVRVRVMLAADGSEAELSSTLGRELAFASHHAVHHHAMIAAVARELGQRCPEEFGKAPATLHDAAPRA